MEQIIPLVMVGLLAILIIVNLPPLGPKDPPERL